MDFLFEFPWAFIVIYFILRDAVNHKNPFRDTLLLLSGLTIIFLILYVADHIPTGHGDQVQLVWMFATCFFGWIWRQTIGIHWTSTRLGQRRRPYD